MDQPQAMLFDFSGTLMRVEPAERWVRAVTRDAGLDLSPAEIENWAARLSVVGAYYGSFPEDIPAHLRELWDNRDLDEPHHRAAYTGLIQESGWPWPELVEALYERANHPEAWLPYPDALETLSRARAMGISTALISNISFDVRPHLKDAGLLEHLDVVLLSYEVGMIKPDPRIFALACELLEADPERSVMVGDHVADGGGQAIGVRTFFVEPVPTDERPHALINVLREVMA